MNKIVGSLIPTGKNRRSSKQFAEWGKGEVTESGLLLWSRLCEAQAHGAQCRSYRLERFLKETSQVRPLLFVTAS